MASLNWDTEYITRTTYYQNQKRGIQRMLTILNVKTVKPLVNQFDVFINFIRKSVGIVSYCKNAFYQKYSIG